MQNLTCKFVNVIITRDDHSFFNPVIAICLSLRISFVVPLLSQVAKVNISKLIFTILMSINTIPLQKPHLNLALVGDRVQSSAISGAGRGTGWRLYTVVCMYLWRRYSEEHQLLISSSVHMCVKVLQCSGLPAGSPRDLASLGLCEDRGGVCPGGGGGGCGRQAAQGGWSRDTFLA